MKFRVLFLWATFAMLPVVAGAQATGTGAVIGRITDSSGGVLPGVSVTLRSPEALGTYTAVTDSDGRYRISNLAPASYEARAELQGFQAAVQRVAVRIGATLTVDFLLAVSETVDVMGETPIVDSERAGLAVNINNEALTSLPISTQRRYQDVWRWFRACSSGPTRPTSTRA